MNISEIFAENVFNDNVMRERLPKDVYKSLKHTIEEGLPLQPHVATVVANAMKDWAIEKGATHFTHWFQPMTGITAEKHDSFVSIKDGKVIMEFSGKELIKGESDASSFPSGGLRATFEARGYTAWDPTAYAFLKDGTLCIPTAFCSYGGHALDKKTPLLRSMEALNKQALRVLKLFGNTTVTRVMPTVGAEQEYFLIDKKLYDKRQDLIMSGRTLFGAKAPKGQELDDHYYGAIRPRVSAFMKELDIELWKLGVYAKTKHNEVAPSQHELAPIFTTTNVATDHNQITMEIMKNVAERHGLVCLLHEKPFEHVNGSGKHINWSMTTNTGANLFEPGSSPAENAQFMLFFASVIKAVDEYQDLLRMTVASAGNDCRLGSAEAPPAIISVFIGDELAEIISAIEKGEKVKAKARKVMKLGVDSLPDFPMDTTDRNRTSPFAFTGNKFEFRMPGSSLSISGPNIILNTIVAEVLDGFASELENAEDFNLALNNLVSKTIKKHKRIIFNGNNYSQEWIEEAEKRGLLNLQSSDKAIPCFKTKRNISLFEKHGVFKDVEVISRTDILLENYYKTLKIEANTMIDMAKRQIYPAIERYVKDVAKTVEVKKSISKTLPINTEIKLLETLCTLNENIMLKAEELDELLTKVKDIKTDEELSSFYRENVVVCMAELRKNADVAETLVGKSYWPFPTYSDLLFSV